MNSANYESTRKQLEEAIKNIRPTYKLDVLVKALFSLSFERKPARENITIAISSWVRFDFERFLRIIKIDIKIKIIKKSIP